MVDMAHPAGFCLPQSPQGRRTVHSKSIKKPVVPPIKEQKLEDPQVSGEPGTKVTGVARGLEKFFPCLGGELKSQPSLQGVGGPWLLGCQPQATLVTMTPSLPKPPSSEPKLDLQPEPTAKFLFTLLNVTEPPKTKDRDE